MKKNHRLEIEPLYELEGPRYGWYSKGHHSAADFRYALRMREGVETEEKAGDPQYEWWRYVPFGTNNEYRGTAGYLGTYQQAVGGSRGAFPVTVAYDRGTAWRLT